MLLAYFLRVWLSYWVMNSGVKSIPFQALPCVFILDYWPICVAVCCIFLTSLNLRMGLPLLHLLVAQVSRIFGADYKAPQFYGAYAARHF